MPRASASARPKRHRVAGRFDGGDERIGRGRSVSRSARPGGKDAHKLASRRRYGRRKAQIRLSA
jgi:hypothetical protein